MRAVVTGLNGTLAPRVAAAARARGWQVLGWDRTLLPPHDAQAGRDWLLRERPDAILHLAMGDAAWAGWLARHAADAGIACVFTSTAMVFDHVPDGPHRPHDPRTAKDDYGRGKIACEDAVLAAGGCVARIGWQIDAAQPGNNMLLQLDAQQQRDGCIAASRAWTPACSFMDDTAQALLDLADEPCGGGIVHLDSNAADAWRFDAVVAALARRFGRDGWTVRVGDDYRHDQRLLDGGTHTRPLPPLSARLPSVSCSGRRQRIGPPAARQRKGSNRCRSS